MKRLSRIEVAIVAAVCTSLSLVSAPTHAQSPSPSADPKEIPVSTRATGTFDVKLSPEADDSPIGRMSIDKHFHGDLEATSKGQMLAFSTDVKGSAGYVAMEKVTGNLMGRTGTFVLQHSGSMDRGEPSLTITVVPDSGTDGLKGLTGKMTIIIEGGKHSYEFDYTIDEG